MIANLVPAVLSLKTGTYAVRRTRRGLALKGKYSSGPSSVLEIEAQVSPMEGEELLRLPELSRTEEVRRVITPSRLYAQTSAYEADLVTIDDDEWEVSVLKDWSKMGGFYEAYVTRVKR